MSSMNDPKVLMADGNAASTFPLFRNLPLEIRQMIWNQALPGPRVVHIEMRRRKGDTCPRIRSDIDVDGSSNDEFFDPPETWLDPCPPHHSPATWRSRPSRPRPGKTYGPIHSYVPRFSASPITSMAVCRESRAVACKVYTLSFGTQFAPPSVWFSFELDTLHMSSHVVDGFEKHEHEIEDLGTDIKMIRKLSLSEPCNLQRRDPQRQFPFIWYAETIAPFCALETLTYVIDEYEEKDWANLVLMDPEVALAGFLSHGTEYSRARERKWNMHRPNWEKRAACYLIEEVAELRIHGYDCRGWKLPKMQRMVATTPQKKATLEKNVTDLMRLTVKSLDRHDSLSVIATSCTTIGDLDLAFRKENQIPEAESTRMLLMDIDGIINNANHRDLPFSRRVFDIEELRKRGDLVIVVGR